MSNVDGYSEIQNIMVHCNIVKSTSSAFYIRIEIMRRKETAASRLMQSFRS